MDAADRVLLRLADPAERQTVLDGGALLQLAATCYDIDPAAVTGPTTAIYDRFDLAVPLVSETAATARVMRAGDAVPWDVSAFWDNGQPPGPGADAVMAGSVVVRTQALGGLIEQVDLSETEAKAPYNAGIGVMLQMSAPQNGNTPPPLVLPVVVAFLVGDGGSPRELLRATAAARRVTRTYPSPSPPDEAPPRRADRAVCWLVPGTAFDDDGWPGGTGATPEAQRATRLAAARAWLGTQGIAVVITT
jgi:hypothetical protein